MPQPYGAADLPYLMQEMGVDVSFNGATTRAFFTIADVQVFDEFEGPPQVAKRTVAQIIKGSLPGIAVGSTLTCGAESWRVREMFDIEDGAFTEMRLSD